MLQRFWSSGILTGNQTSIELSALSALFWSSGILTGIKRNAEGDSRNCHCASLEIVAVSMRGGGDRVSLAVIAKEWR